LIKGGGIQLNDAKVTDEGATVTAADLTNDGAAKLTAGKKRHALVRAEG
ncbi:MAG TPA: tyrosine--tRNA ligase, partial [Azospirillaceae bacterium]|nr:tyrosine--tRNA ligase [Azospirillaceae bacterium]